MTVRTLATCSLLLFASLIPAVAGAQETDAVEESENDRVRYLLRAGGTWADLRGRVEFDDQGAVPFESDFGFSVGAAVEVRVAGAFSIQPEALIVRRFAQVGGQEDTAGPSSKLSSHYLELPVYLKWYPSGRTGARGSVVLGVVPAIRLGATREIRDGNMIEDVPADDLLAPVDWSIGIGGGFEFSEAFANFTIDLRYVHGFTDMNAPDSSVSARWSTVQLVIGIAF